MRLWTAILCACLRLHYQSISLSIEPLTCTTCDCRAYWHYRFRLLETRLNAVRMPDLLCSRGLAVLGWLVAFCPPLSHLPPCILPACLPYSFATLPRVPPYGVTCAARRGRRCAAFSFKKRRGGRYRLWSSPGRDTSRVPSRVTSLRGSVPVAVSLASRNARSNTRAPLGRALPVGSLALPVREKADSFTCSAEPRTTLYAAGRATW